MELRVTQGTLLAAGLDLLDPNFVRTVVLICQHTAEGAGGLVLNRPLPQTTRELLSEHPLLGKLDFPLHQGGPVGLDTMQIVHRAPDEIAGGVEIAKDLWVGGELESVAAYVAAAPEKAQARVRLVVGYSGWSPGQLEMELTAGAWLPAPTASAPVFELVGEELWRHVLRSLDGPWAKLCDEMGDPNRN